MELAGQNGQATERATAVQGLLKAQANHLAAHCCPQRILALFRDQTTDSQNDGVVLKMVEHLAERCVKPLVEVVVDYRVSTLR